MNLTGSSAAQASQPVALKGIKVQTSAFGVSKTIVWGQTRIVGNVIWYGDFVVTAQSSGGGK
jgi:hypothetical protein